MPWAAGLPAACVVDGAPETTAGGRTAAVEGPAAEEAPVAAERPAADGPAVALPEAWEPWLSYHVR